jgi:hypothetical protein
VLCSFTGVSYKRHLIMIMDKYLDDLQFDIQYNFETIKQTPQGVVLALYKRRFIEVFSLARQEASLDEFEYCHWWFVRPYQSYIQHRDFNRVIIEILYDNIHDLQALFPKASVHEKSPRIADIFSPSCVPYSSSSFYSTAQVPIPT